MKVETVSEQLFFVTAYITATGKGHAWSGTAFVYAVNTNQGPAHFLVTNKHVLADADHYEIRFVRGRPDGQPDLGRTVTAHVGSHGTWVGHLDPEIDVAVVPIAPILNPLIAGGNQPFFKSLTPDLVPSSSEWAELDALERVVFIGYPAGLYDSANMTPILREGITATPLALDYRGKPTFLVDAAVFPGSSGSPVLLFDRGMYQTRQGGTVVGTRLKLLGVLAALHSQIQTAPVLESPTSLVAEVKTALGLGIVYKAPAIDSCIDQVLGPAGVSRVVGSVQDPAPTTPSRADRTVQES
jgi:hypothetical protein